MSSFYNEEAEKSVIGSMMQSPECCKELPALDESEFQFLENKKVLQAMQVLYSAKRPIDLITLDEQCEAMFPASKLTAHMIDCQQFTPTTANFREYLSIVKSCAKRRKVREIADRMMHEVESSDPDEVMENARSEMRGMKSAGNVWTATNHVAMKAFEHISDLHDGKIKTIPTPLSRLNVLTGGWHKGELTIVGARTSVGKSAFSMLCALKAAQAGETVGFCSREMVEEQYGTRMISALAQVDGNKFRSYEASQKITDAEWERIAQCAGELSTYRIPFCFSVKDVEKLRAEVERKVETDAMSVLVIDYLQKYDTVRKIEAERLRIAQLTSVLKDIAVDFEIPVICLSQLKRGDGVPKLEDLRESGMIENDADEVLFMMRVEGTGQPGYPKGMTDSAFDAIMGRGNKLIRFEVAKQRQGALGEFYTEFNPSIMKYTEIEGW